MNVAEIFFNQSSRLRSGWRFLVFLFAVLFVSSFFGAVVREVLTRLPIGFNENSLLSFIYPNFILLTAAIFVGWLCGRFLENLPFRALGCWFTKNWFKDLSFGLILGAVSLLFAAFIGIIFGGLSFELNRTNRQSAILLTLGISLAVFIVGAAAEEAFFRGYMLQTFARAKLAWLAIALTSLFFASAHLNNPNADYISILNTILAGIWFGVAYLKTRNLWFVFGLHLMWNWAQGAFLGLPVSGITELTTAPLFRVSELGIKQITGGDYGIEGGIAATIAIIVSTLIIWFLPFLKPTEEMLALTSKESVLSEKKPVETFAS
ncbi:MAG: CPBP family intramembrane metalloprotease [Acidobacteria bacterium]|nr:CPBP family intramembrane metalloprotease [Acidobacteriota bacterium]